MKKDTTMITRRTLLAASSAVGLGTSLALRRAQAQGAKLKIGLITTLSGPGGYLGQDIRDAFQLAVDLEGGTLGGAPVQVVVEDDAFKPAQAKEIADRFYKSEGIRLFTGIVFSNILAAAVPDLLDSDAVYVSPNAAPSTFSGKDCNRNYYVVSWNNDSLHEAGGANAQRLGYKRMMLLAPNYQAGKDALTGFKRMFKGEIVKEIYTRLDQTDYAAEMAQIRDAKPDAVYQFHPGGLGIAFMRQYQQAGLLGQIPMTVAEPSMDSTIVTALGDAAIGVTVASHWNTDFDNAANKLFVSAFMKKYNRIPTSYASQGYDAALAIAASLKGTGGKFSGPEAFRTAMLPAKFDSVRGYFAFGPNQHPIQNWYALAVEKGADGKPGLHTKDQILTHYGDAYSAQCKL
jgi:branched-chain amino acid transport system substrate-binding protein